MLMFMKREVGLKKRAFILGRGNLEGRDKEQEEDWSGDPMGRGDAGGLPYRF